MLAFGVATALAAGVAWPVAGRAQDMPPASAAPARSLDELRELPEHELRGYWQARLDEARERARIAAQVLAQAERDYRRVRHRGRIRGEAKAQVEVRLEQAHAELAAAEQALAAIPEEARRSGALPGWLDEAEAL